MPTEIDENASDTSGIASALSRCGPGVITGAANDDPSCIVTFSIAGATFGYLTLWTSVFTLPLIAAMQLMCSRLGMLGGRGLAGAVRVNYPRWVLFPVCAMLAVANVVTLGADLGGMADVTQMVTGISSFLWTAVFGLGIALLLFYLPYSRIEKIFRWLCLALFAYIAAGLLSKPDWSQVMRASVVPQLDWSQQGISTLVAILGATISPYFLFWQTSHEVEAEYCLGRHTVEQRRGATHKELQHSKIDVFAGSFISKLITYFITITTAATLHATGKTEVSSVKDAAAALKPVAGEGAFLLFAAGVLGTGLLAVPVLAGSCAYAWSEALRWRASLTDEPKLAPKFYTVLGVAVAIGTALIYMQFSAVQMLFWASVMNGLLAPICIFLVLRLTGDNKVMAGKSVRGWPRIAGWLAFAVTAAAAFAMIIVSI